MLLECSLTGCKGNVSCVLVPTHCRNFSILLDDLGESCQLFCMWLIQKLSARLRHLSFNSCFPCGEGNLYVEKGRIRQESDMVVAKNVGFLGVFTAADIVIEKGLHRPVIAMMMKN